MLTGSLLIGLTTGTHCNMKNQIQSKFRVRMRSMRTLTTIVEVGAIGPKQHDL